MKQAFVSLGTGSIVLVRLVIPMSSVRRSALSCLAAGRWSAGQLDARPSSGLVRTRTSSAPTALCPKRRPVRRTSR
jgi:hypothetical protein